MKPRPVNFVLIGSRPGRYRTEPVEGLVPEESWDYLLCGRHRASYLIAELQAEGRVRIVDEDGSGTINVVSTRFLETFDSIEAARASLRSLARFGGLDIRLERRP